MTIETEVVAQANLAEAVAAYLPENIVANLVAQTIAANFSPSQPHLINAVTMMVDITGFTPLCEALAKKGREGAEQVTTLINLFFEEALRPVKQQGGVIAKFGGDAFNAFFEQLPGETWDATAQRALYSAFALQKLVQKYQDLRLPGSVDGQVFQLYAKVGLGAGTFLAFGVGIPAQHCDYQVAGEPLNQAAEAEHHAKRGEIIAHNELLVKIAKLNSSPAYLELGEAREVCRLALAYTGLPLSPLNALFNLQELSSVQLAEFLPQAASYIPRAVYERLKLGYLTLPGEHRRVVSLFINFSGFSWLEDSRAPENFNRYYLAILEAVERHGGYLNRISSGDKGDLMHVLFGAPVTHQDDDERAVRCALELQQVARQFEYIQNQQIGLSSGFVFAGDIGSPSRHEYTVIGDTVNLSARLMQIADDWTVLVDEATVRRVGDRFEFGKPRPVQLKGKANFVEVREALRTNENPALVRRTTQQPIFGRENELSSARQLILQGLSGQASLFAICGEAGIGKSFFLERVLTAWQVAGGRLIQTQLVNYERSPFGLWAKWLAQLAGINSKTAFDSRERRLSRFVEGLAPELLEWLPLWGELLALSLTEPPWLRALDRPTRRQRLAEYTAILLERLAQQQPILLFCDDFHWADSASLELLDQTLPRLKNAPLVVCVGFRSDLQPNLKLLNSPQCNQLLLAPLSPEASQGLIQAHLAGKVQVEVPENFIKNVIELSGGNPFYIEELLDTLQVSNTLEKVLTASADQLFSYNLHTIIMDRLDALDGRLREVVLAAAVVGGGFSDEIIRPLLPPSVAENLQSADTSPLKTLHQLDLLLPEAGSSAGVYRFRHALIQQVAYESLPFAHRRTLHEQIGDYFESVSPPEEGLERLAYHYEYSRNDQKAVFYLAKSAAKSARFFANSEALRLYQIALRRAENSSNPTQPDLRQLLTKLGDVQAQTADFEAALTSYAQALENIPVGEVLERLALDYKRCDVLVRATRFPEAIALIEDNRPKFKRNYKRATSLLRAQFAELYSIILGRQAKYSEAYMSAEAGLKFLEKADTRLPAVTTTRIKLYQSLAAAAAVLRKFDVAKLAISRALQTAKKINDPITEGQLQLRLGILGMQTEEIRKAPKYFQLALPLVEKTGARDRIANVLLPGGNTFLFRGNYKQAKLWLERGLKLAYEVNSPFLISIGQNVSGMTAYAVGDWDSAIDFLKASVELTQKKGLWDVLGDSLVRHAQILIYRGSYSEAQLLLDISVSCGKEHNLPSVTTLSQRFQAEAWLYQGLVEQAFTSLGQLKPEEITSARAANLALLLGECYARKTLNKQPTEATNITAEIANLTKLALDYFIIADFRLFLPTAYRVNGLLAWVSGDLLAACEYFKQGIKLAKTTGHLPELARLIVAQESLKITTRFSFSKETALTNLKKAKTLLTNLGAQPELAKLDELLNLLY